MIKNRVVIRLSICWLVTLSSACSSIYTTDNQPITEVDEKSGYRRFHQQKINTGDTTILLAFSGGGTRAAALSYGVMQELRDTLVRADDKSTRLLDEVDTISSVSGGSFTSAYYGIFGEQLFDSFEDDFLRSNVQQNLIRGVLNPVNWVKSAFTGFDRKEMAISYYDRTIFKGATFADINTEDGPFIEINATDLTTGIRFTFNQERFDLICSDLSTYSVARAVTASSAVPVAFPTVVLENHADQCDVTGTKTWQIIEGVLLESEAQESLQQGLESYRNFEERKYIHLVDGGISDNLGLRAALDRIEGLGEARFLSDAGQALRNIVFILVNAHVDAESTVELTAKNPSAKSTMGAFTSAQIERYSQETIDKFRQSVRRINKQFRDNGILTRVYFSQVSFDQVENEDLNKILNSLPTSFELDDDEVGQVITAGRILLRQEPSYIRFKERNEGRLVEGAISNREICTYFSLAECSE